jgi:hypothetical protein
MHANLERFRDTLTEEPTTPEECLLQTVLGVSPGPQGPNLFDFATSERCQDAFLSWLIAWAQHHPGQTNQPLHRTGVFFLNRLLGLHQIPLPDKYKHVRISRYKHIDILVRVNEDIVVLIKDTLDFVGPTGQLEHDLGVVRNDFEGWTPVPVYLRTGDRQDDKAIEEAGWKCFQRGDLLEVLEYGRGQGVESDIFRDFHSRLRQKEEGFGGRSAPVPVPWTGPGCGPDPVRPPVPPAPERRAWRPPRATPAPVLDLLKPSTEAAGRARS